LSDRRSPALQPLEPASWSGDLDAAELQVKLVGEGAAAARRAAAVDGEDDPALVDQILVERAGPAAHHLPADGPA
jgi:hypothetical protein